jgi:hypothetical protein
LVLNAEILEQSASSGTHAHASFRPGAVGLGVEQALAHDPQREVRLHLRALASYLAVANHPFCEANRAALLLHDFAPELRIIRDFAMRCAALLGQNPTHAAGSFVSSNFYGEGARSGLSGDSNSILPAHESLASSVVLGDLHLLCEGLLEARSVSFRTWTSFTRLGMRQLSAMAGDLIGDDASEWRVTVTSDLQALTAGISPDSLSADVSLVFQRLLGMLEVTKLIGAALAADEPLKLTLPFFTLLRSETRRLLDLLTERTLRIEGLDPAVHEYLDGVAYAIRMELRKAFEHELVGLAALRNATQLFGRIENAHGLLRDCFQQSVISVARVFNPRFDADGLFNNFKTKLEQSLLLRGELWDILSASKRGGESGLFDLGDLLGRLDKFRTGSLRFLMYKDWEAFERFVEELSAAKSTAQLQPVLHRFQAFLETLFSQVSMRAVLADYPFVPPDSTR